MLVSVALFLGFTPFTCGAMAAVPSATSDCCCGDTSEEAPAQHTGCECFVESCDSLPIERSLAISPLAPVGLAIPFLSRLPAAEYLGDAMFFIPPVLDTGPGIIEQIQCVRLLL